MLVAIVKAVPVLFWNLAVVVDHRPLRVLVAVEVLRGLAAIDFDRRMRVDAVPTLEDAPYMLFEERKIPNITRRVVVLPCRVPDVELDVRETVI